MEEPGFGADLYRGTAEAYDRHRLLYPPAMVSALLERVAGRTRAMDLACGTGQLTVPLCRSFVSTWAVDQEPEMVRVVTAKRLPGVRAVVSAAENLDAPAGAFDLIVIGNAFHRLRRDRVASRAFSWLRPGGSLALCWSDSPWEGPAPWQEVFRSVIASWRDRLGDRLPPGWRAAREATPDPVVLREAGFTLRGRTSFEVTHRWTASSLAGFVWSTSILPRPAFGERAGEFQAELAERLAPYPLTATVGFAFDLASRGPGQAGTR